MEIVIIGTGKLAYILGHNFLDAGHSIKQIAGRSQKKASELASSLNSDYSSFDDINTTCDIYLLAISDDAIEIVSEKLPQVKGIVIHCSGNTTIDLIINHKYRGVLYPLDSFSKKTLKSLRNTPVLIESADNNSINILNELAESITNNVHYLTSANRAEVHLSAVLTNNFINFLSAKAKKRLTDRDIDPAILNQLLNTTLTHITENDPSILQTGPAIRKDTSTIINHLEMLNDDVKLKELYKIFSEEIMLMNKSKKNHD